jgi:dynein heavy chain
MYVVKLAELETNLLNNLTDANPDTILENIELIDSLEVTKKTSIEIQQKQEEAKTTEIDINKSRETYRPVAAEGAMLYFLLI